MIRTAGLGWVGLWIAGTLSGQLVTLDFSEIELSAESYLQVGAGTATLVKTSGVELPHTTPAWGGFSQFTVSNQTDTVTAGFANSASAITGGGVNNANYGVVYNSPPQRLEFTAAGGVTPVGIYVTNTTYAYLSMRDGDEFAKRFGGADGREEDVFTLTISGLNVADEVTGTVVVYLADFRAGKAELVDDWTWVDLSSLGTAVTALEFGLASTDMGTWGMNTPAYFAFDEMSYAIIPEASHGAVIVVIATLLASLRRCQRSRRQTTPQAL